MGPILSHRFEGDGIKNLALVPFDLNKGDQFFSRLNRVETMAAANASANAEDAFAGGVSCFEGSGVGRTAGRAKRNRSTVLHLIRLACLYLIARMRVRVTP